MAELEKSLERYDVLDRIAVGGMAEVFLAKAYGAHGFEKTLAIKRILPELARDPEFEARFIAEAKVAVKLTHANIVQVLDFGRVADSLFIAMEYIDGLDLAALLRRYKDRGLKLPQPAAFQIAIELARALDFAHSHGVVHRDVSPSNILLSRAGEVKIADFGIAVAARPHRSRSGLGPRKVMGKWRYMSPEQALGEVLDTRSDLFSAASVMFELFTGEKLFTGDDAEQITRNIQNMPIPSLRSVRPELPARLDEILAAPLARQPNDRPQRAALLVRALTELSYESSIVATSLDVADAVGAVLESTAASRSVLDDIIRAQLGGDGAAADHGDNSITREKRQTSVGTGSIGASTQGTEEGTGVFVSRLDGDGVSHLELEATHAAQPRSRRSPGGEALIPGSDQTPSGAGTTGTATGARRTLRPEVPVAPAALDAEAALDPDRRTQVGPPLDDSRPLIKYAGLGEELEAAPAVVVTKPALPPAPVPVLPPAPIVAAPPPRRSRAMLGVGAALLAVGLGVVVWRVSRAPTSPPAPIAVITPRPIDAAPAPITTGTLEIVSDPQGATGTATATSTGASVTITATPARVTVPAGVPLRLQLELARYQPYVDDALIVAPGELMRVRAAMVPAKAGLVVTSEPDGATVSLDGRRLGETPLTRRDLDPAPHGQLTISKDGFVSQSASVVLVFGETATVRRVLKAEQKFGEIQISVVQAGGAGWADAYLRGKKIGRASVTDQPLRLPVGPNRLRLVNPVTKAEKSLDLTIVEGRNPPRSVHLDPATP